MPREKSEIVRSFLAVVEGKQLLPGQPVEIQTNPVGISAKSNTLKNFVVNQDPFRVFSWRVTFNGDTIYATPGSKHPKMARKGPNAVLAPPLTATQVEVPLPFNPPPLVQNPVKEAAFLVVKNLSGEIRKLIEVQTALMLVYGITEEDLGR